MEFPLQGIAAWNKQDKPLVANIYSVRNEHAVVFCAGNAVGRNVTPIQSETFVLVKCSEREISLDSAKTDHDAPYFVDVVVVFSPKYHSGVPCLSAFRFPAP